MDTLKRIITCALILVFAVSNLTFATVSILKVSDFTGVYASGDLANRWLITLDAKGVNVQERLIGTTKLSSKKYYEVKYIVKGQQISFTGKLAGVISKVGKNQYKIKIGKNISFVGFKSTSANQVLNDSRVKKQIAAEKVPETTKKTDDIPVTTKPVVSMRDIPEENRLALLEEDLISGKVSMIAGMKKYEFSMDWDSAAISLLNKLRRSVDYDKDGMTDHDEIFLYGTNSEKADSDGDGITDSDWNERREYNYSVHFNVRFIQPFDVKFMEEHHAQDVKVIEETSEYVDVELVVYPVNNLGRTFVGNKNWKRDNAAVMSEVKPGYFNDWDTQMQKDLIELLKRNGIDPDTMDDKALVTSTILFFNNQHMNKTNIVSPNTMTHMFDWYIKRNKTDGSYTFDASRNRPEQVLADLNKAAIDLTTATGQQWNVKKITDTISSGKNMFYNRMHGSCSGTSEFYATVFQALGIPTKVMAQRTNLDATDRPNYAQVLMAQRREDIDNLSNKSISAYLSRAKNGSVHVINYIYIGNRWVDLDVASKGRINTSPLYDNFIRFFTAADYDFTDDLQAIVDSWLRTTFNESQLRSVAVSNNFQNSNVNEGVNELGNLGLKIFNFTDMYGKHMSDSTRMNVDYFDPERPINGYNQPIGLQPPKIIKIN